MREGHFTRSPPRSTLVCNAFSKISFLLPGPDLVSGPARVGANSVVGDRGRSSGHYLDGGSAQLKMELPAAYDNSPKPLIIWDENAIAELSAYLPFRNNQ